jgi:hypothetical protein
MRAIPTLDRIIACAQHAQEAEANYHGLDTQTCPTEELVIEMASAIRQLSERIIGEGLEEEEARHTREFLEALFRQYPGKESALFTFIESYARWMREAAILGQDKWSIPLESFPPRLPTTVQKNLRINDRNFSSFGTLENNCHGVNTLPVTWFLQAQNFGYEILHAHAHMGGDTTGVGYTVWRSARSQIGRTEITLARMGLDQRMHEEDRTALVEKFCNSIRESLPDSPCSHYRIIVPASDDTLPAPLQNAGFRVVKTVKDAYALGNGGWEGTPGPYEDAIVLTKVEGKYGWR